MKSLGTMRTLALLAGLGWVVWLTGCSGGQGVETESGIENSQDQNNDQQGDGEDDDSAVACDPSIGAVEAIRPCSDDDPCQRLLPLYDDVDVLSDAIDEPECRTTHSEDRDVFDDGAPETIEGLDGTTRYHCEYRPESEDKRPLVVMFHGSGGSAATIYNFTHLRRQAGEFQWDGDQGFVLVSPQARNLHWPTDTAQDGSKFDYYHRDLEAPSGNPDIAYVDELIDNLVATGDVDPQRIHVMGWSNGGHFAQMYAIARHENATPEGHRVASAAIFSAADPFQEISHTAPDPPCRLDPYPTSEVPIFVVSRACDVVACDRAQAQSLVEDELRTPPGGGVETWMEDLQDRVGNQSSKWRIVGGDGQETERCTGPAICGPNIAIINHLRWPDGVADDSGIDHESDMLQFLVDHPL